MKATEIKTMKSQGLTNDQIYERAAGVLGYYGIAFFGHRFSDPRRTRRAKEVLNRIWKRILAN